MGEDLTEADLTALFILGVDGLRIKVSYLVELDLLGTKALYNLGVDGY